MKIRGGWEARWAQGCSHCVCRHRIVMQESCVAVGAKLNEKLGSGLWCLNMSTQTLTSGVRRAPGRAWCGTMVGLWGNVPVAAVQCTAMLFFLPRDHRLTPFRSGSSRFLPTARVVRYYYTSPQLCLSSARRRLITGKFVYCTPTQFRLGQDRQRV